MWSQVPVSYDKHALWGISHWGPKRQQFYRFATNKESAQDVYSKRRIIAVTKLQIIKWHNYKHLDWITVHRDDDKLSIVIQRRVEDLQLGVESYQKKLNLTKLDTYKSDLKQREAYTSYSNPRGFIYQNKDKKNRLMRINELHKFSNGTLNDVRTALNDRLKGIRMKYLPQNIWRQSDRDKAGAMIQAIDKQLKTRRIMRILEKFIDAPVMRTASAAAKPCQGDSSEFYLITSSIYTDQRGTVVLPTIGAADSRRTSATLIPDEVLKLKNLKKDALLKLFKFTYQESRYYDLDENCYPTFWANDDEEMFLFAFINHADPTKVRIGEREVAEGDGAGNDNMNDEGGDAAVADHTEQSDHIIQVGGIDIVADDETQAIVADKPNRLRKKRKAADGASGSGLPPKKLREDHGVSGDVSASTTGKSLAVLQGLLDSSTLAVEIGATTAATLLFVTSFVTPTPKREGGGHGDSVTGLNLRTQLASESFVVLTDSSHHSSTHATDDEVTSIVRSSMSPPPVLTAAVATTIIADVTSAPAPRVGTRQVPPSNFRDFASIGEANQDIASPSHLVGTELFTDSFFVSQDVDSETLHQIYIPK
ncbi:hypothetical protein Tco_0948646 [Tanacetum coccineum]